MNKFTLTRASTQELGHSPPLWNLTCTHLTQSRTSHGLIYGISLKFLYVHLCEDAMCLKPIQAADPMNVMNQFDESSNTSFQKVHGVRKYQCLIMKLKQHLRLT